MDIFRTAARVLKPRAIAWSFDAATRSSVSGCCCCYSYQGVFTTSRSYRKHEMPTAASHLVLTSARLAPPGRGLHLRV
jgi:hypothetical protein